MIPSNEILKRKDEIKDFVAAADLEKAIRRLLDFVREFYPQAEDDVILLSGQYNDLKKTEIGNLISNDDSGVKKSQLGKSILQILETVMEALRNSIEENKNPSLLGNQQHLEAILAEQVRAKETPNNVILIANNLRRQYRSTGFKFELDKLELRLGEITGLVGENATGKTTFLRILAGDLIFDKGQLQYPLFHKGKTLDWIKIKQHIAYVPQEVIPWRGSLIDNLKYEAAIKGIKGEANTKEVNHIIHRLGLAEFINNSWNQLSGGYKLRFSLAKALVGKPQFLLIDEPLANLDIKTQIIVLNDLQHLAKSTTFPLSILISSQHLHEIETVADQMLFMRNGKLENLGKTKNFLADRDRNVFEISCGDTYSEFLKTLEDFEYLNLWYTGMNFIISTSTKLSGNDLIQYLESKKVKIHCYREISQSIKMKFYEADI